MVRHTLKILQHVLQDFESISDHFEALRIKELALTTVKEEKCIQLKLYLVSSPRVYPEVAEVFGEIKGWLSIKEYVFILRGVPGPPQT